MFQSQYKSVQSVQVIEKSLLVFLVFIIMHCFPLLFHNLYQYYRSLKFESRSFKVLSKFAALLTDIYRQKLLNTI